MNTSEGMTLHEAKDRCIELNTTIASPDDLREAMNLGLDSCQCNWLSDGSQAFPSSKPTSCYSGPTGLIACETQTGKTWCRV